ncbi:hypothetical protein J7E73_03880 [Paenibacillus albidus]|uniref:hypothetical protein n=1 Tax=Paenibacillus albidus TaxID=2041023 RepID=UPI001BE5E9FF|nr:hypothetical protein [Paenibacillus albidus]MBT2288288.1 hypothetical protein [Paenibacillus albidus]
MQSQADLAEMLVNVPEVGAAPFSIERCSSMLQGLVQIVISRVNGCYNSNYEGSE